MSKTDKAVKIDPSEYSLPPRTELRQSGENRMTLLINRKSRIIMKDGQNILSKIEKIRLKAPKMSVELETTAPVCSKTEKFLRENGIAVRKV